MQHEEKYRTSIAEQSKYRRAFAWAAATPVVSARSTGSPLLLSQPPDVVLTILMELDAVGLSRAACSCRQLRHFVHQHAGPLWRNRLEAEGIALTAHRQSPTDWRWLYWRLSGTLEVRGWADEHAVNAGENLAWWRCRAVGYDGVRVKVRFLGYEKEDDEWRSVGAHLRHYHDAAKCAAWLKQKRQVGEEIEITWAAKGHPVLLWEAHVAAVVELKKGGASTPEKCWVRVKYDGFDDAWDELVPVRSTRLRPRRAAPSVGHAAARMGVGGAP